MVIAGASCYAQPIGYQGKTMMLSLGYAPGSNTTAIFNESAEFINDATPDGGTIPFELIHVPRIQFEAVVFDQSSFFIRFNPYNIDVNAEWFDGIQSEYKLASISSKGAMFHIGYKHYYTPTPAPLGVYWGLMLSRYNFKTTLENHPDEDQALPTEMLSYSLQPSGAFGVGAMAGLQSIFKDCITLDLSIELGYLLNNPEESMTFDPEAFGTDFYFTNPVYPQTMVMTNARTFFLATPAISVGYLF